MAGIIRQSYEDSEISQYEIVADSLLLYDPIGGTSGSPNNYCRKIVVDISDEPTSVIAYGSSKLYFHFLIPVMTDSLCHKMLSALVRSKDVSIAPIIAEVIMDFVREEFSGNIYHNTYLAVETENRGVDEHGKTYMELDMFKIGPCIHKALTLFYEWAGTKHTIELPKTVRPDEEQENSGNDSAYIRLGRIIDVVVSYMLDESIWKAWPASWGSCSGRRDIGCIMDGWLAINDGTMDSDTLAEEARKTKESKYSKRVEAIMLSGRDEKDGGMTNIRTINSTKNHVIYRQLHIGEST